MMDLYTIEINETKTTTTRVGNPFLGRRRPIHRRNHRLQHRRPSPVPPTPGLLRLLDVHIFGGLDDL